MHFFVILLFFLNPYIYAYNAVKRFFDNSRNSDAPEETGNAVSFLIWSNIYTYWLLYLDRRDQTDSSLIRIAENTQKGYFVEFFAMFNAAFFLLMITCPALLVARAGARELLINTVIRCAALNISVQIILIVASILLKRNGFSGIGYNNDPVDLRYYAIVLSVPGLLSLLFSLQSLRQQKMLKYPAISCWIFIVIFPATWWIWDGGHLEAWITVNGSLYFEDPVAFRHNFWKLFQNLLNHYRIF